MNSTDHRTIALLAAAALSTAACSGGDATDAGPSSANPAPVSAVEPDETPSSEMTDGTNPEADDAGGIEFDESDPTATALRDHFAAVDLAVPDGETQCTADAVDDTTVMDLIAAGWGTETFRPLEADMLPIFEAQDACWSRDTLVEYFAAVNVDTEATREDAECMVGGIMALGGTVGVFGSDDPSVFARIVGRCLR